MFCQLVMFHDPELALHIQNMGFIPGKLFSIVFVSLLILHTLSSPFLEQNE